jgi:hypothetical protein
MNWNEALLSLKTNIGLDLHLTPEKNFKYVREIPPYKCSNYNNVEGFRVQVCEKSFVNIPLEISVSRLFLVLSENANGCPINNIIKQDLSYKTNKVIHNGSWLAVPYDIARFLNQDETNVVLNDFNNERKNAFGVDLMSQE